MARKNKAGQGRKPGIKKVAFGVSIPVELHERLESERAAALQQKNIVVQQALEMYLTHKEKERGTKGKSKRWQSEVVIPRDS
jgi:metal-responsive CopG/Arc/MetJ family transcriptional regulator